MRSHLRPLPTLLFFLQTAKHKMLFLTAKRFRLLDPFTGTTRDAVYPVFTAGEVQRLWRGVHALGHNLAARSMSDLQRSRWMELDFEELARAVKWVVPRTPAQIRNVWQTEWRAFLRAEKERLDWLRWKWQPDWEWGGLELDVATPGVAWRSALDLDGELGGRVRATWDVLPLDSEPRLAMASPMNRHYRSLLDAHDEDWTDSDGSSAKDSSNDDADDANDDASAPPRARPAPRPGSSQLHRRTTALKRASSAAASLRPAAAGDDPEADDAVSLPEYVATGLPLRNREAPLNRHRMEAMALDVQSMDMIRPSVTPVRPHRTLSLRGTDGFAAPGSPMVGSGDFDVEFWPPASPALTSPMTMTAAGSPARWARTARSTRMAKTSLRPGSSSSLRRAVANGTPALDLPTQAAAVSRPPLSRSPCLSARTDGRHGQPRSSSWNSKLSVPPDIRTTPTLRTPGARGVGAGAGAGAGTGAGGTSNSTTAIMQPASAASSPSVWGGGPDRLSTTCLHHERVNRGLLSPPGASAMLATARSMPPSQAPAGRALVLSYYGVGSDHVGSVAEAIVELETTRASRSRAATRRADAAASALSATTAAHDNQRRAAEEAKVQLAARRAAIKAELAAADPWERQRRLKLQDKELVDVLGDHLHNPDTLHHLNCDSKFQWPPSRPTSANATSVSSGDLDETLFDVPEPGDAVAAVPPLTHLILRDNNVRDAGMHDVLERVRMMTALSTLDLSSNHITARGAAQVKETLRYTRLQLRALVLEDNKLGDVGAGHLVAGLVASKCVSTLTHLDLGRNGLRSGAALASAVRSMPALASLDVSWNELTAKAAIELAAALPTSTSLRAIRLQMNRSVDDFAVAALFRACTSPAVTTTARPVPAAPRRRRKSGRGRRRSPARSSSSRKGPPPVKIPKPPPSTRVVAAAVCPAGSRGGGCKLHVLDLSHTGAGPEAGHAAVECFKSWLQPMRAVPDAEVQKHVEAHGTEAHGLDFLRGRMDVQPDNEESWGVVRGLRHLDVSGTLVPVADVDALRKAAADALATIPATLTSVCQAFDKLWEADLQERKAKLDAQRAEYEDRRARAQAVIDEEKAVHDDLEQRRHAMYADVFGQAAKEALKERQALASVKAFRASVSLPTRGFMDDDRLTSRYILMHKVLRSNRLQEALKLPTVIVLLADGVDPAKGRGPAGYTALA